MGIFKGIPLFLGGVILSMLLMACSESNEQNSAKAEWEEKVKTQVLTDFVELDLQLQLPLSDWPAIQQGLIPQTQEDRWLILHQAPFLKFFRSHTTTLIFQCSVEKHSQFILISSCQMNQDRNAVHSTLDAEANNSLLELLSVLLDRPVNKN